MVTLERSGPAGCFLESFIDAFLRQALCVLHLARQSGGSVANFPPGARLGLCEWGWPGQRSQWDLALQM